ncbi:hypothetical protein [Variovorax paradoxus]|uniref:HEAT repeat domain-containing protein n=1 Tax=Variovorax paradoxus TaxID=34073 RepID=UPI001ABCD547
MHDEPAEEAIQQDVRALPPVGAAAALAGYEYQLNVSVLAALRLLLITKSAARVTLEPANNEDLEADLTPDQPGRVEARAQLADGHRLVVQVKFRSGEPWSIADFEKLLNHGTQRKPAKRHLDDADARYLLVTNADAKGVARQLLVDDFEEFADALEFPNSLSKTLPNSPAGRVSIWGGLTERRIDLEVNHILNDLLRVPHARRSACREQLRLEAERRMRGSNAGTWARVDLLAVIRRHGGHLASAAELETFVKPSNFEQMVSLLNEKNAIVITGRSGTGKTLTALTLCELAIQREPGLDVVAVKLNDDPSATRRFAETGSTLFYIEDPWGQFCLRHGSEAWTEQLPRLLRSASPGRRYVITSRSDMLGYARADQDLARWSVELTAEHYSGGELALIYDKRMHLLPPFLQPKALSFRHGALDALETPLELDLFFTHLAAGPNPEEADHAFFRRLRDLAHRDAVEAVVIKYLDSIDDTGLSAVIWGLLAARGQFDRTQLTALQRQVRKMHAALGDRLEKAVDRLIATRHLRQPSLSVSFAHPSVRAGFERFLSENWSRSEGALGLLVSALIALTGQHGVWGQETAARVLDVSMKFGHGFEGKHTKFEASQADRAAIDAWLDASLLEPGMDFPPVLQLAADVGTSASLPSELARWLTRSFQRGGAFFISDWQPPEYADAWYDRARADPRSAVIIDRFIREQLPLDHSTYADDFVDRIDRISSSHTTAFLEVAQRMIGAGFDSNVHAVVAGAIRDIAGYEAVLSKALDEFAALPGVHHESGVSADRMRAVEDGEYDAADAEAYASIDDDSGYGSNAVIKVYIEARRASACWRALAAHVRVSDLTWHWARAIEKSEEPVTAEEVRALLDAAHASGDEHAGWDAARVHWHEEFSARLEKRIISQPADPRLRSALTWCAYTNAPAMLIRYLDVLANSPSALIQLLVDLHDLDGRLGPKGTRSLLTRLPAQATEILNALGSGGDGASPVGRAALALLEKATEDCTAPALAAIVPAMIASGSRPSAAVKRWLGVASESLDAVAATKAAIAIGDQSIVWLALDHSRADARRAALEHLATHSSGLLPPRLLELVRDRSHRVRRSLIGLLGARPHAAHVPVLLRMAKDQWSDAEWGCDDPDSFPLAREAVAALARYPLFTDETGMEFFNLARATTDRRLRRDALRAAAQRSGPQIRQAIWTIAVDKKLRWERVDSVDALSAASDVEPILLVKVTAEKLMRLPAPLAVSMAVLVGTHLPVDDAVLVLEQVGHSHTHQALVLVAAVALQSRDRAAALGLLELLDVGHPARRLLDFEGDLLPRTVLDTLGDVRIRKAVQARLEERISGKDEPSALPK